MRRYQEGDRVRILRGSLAGQIYTVHQSEADWVTLKEMMKKDPGRFVMSKGNVEPEDGFTDAEMKQAESIAKVGGA
jgi:hypothetical protein